MDDGRCNASAHSGGAGESDSRLSTRRCKMYDGRWMMEVIIAEE